MKHVKIFSYCVMIIPMLILSFLTSTNMQGQTASDYVSLKQKVVIANGSYTDVALEKKLHIKVCVDLKDKNSRFNYVNLRDKPWGMSANFEEHYNIYSRESNSQGEMLYWTTSSIDKQVVLFKLDSNAAIPTMTMSRYSQGNEVVKRTIYYLE